MRTVLAALLILSCLSACGEGKSEITSYDDCVAAGHPQLKTYPGQCLMPDGTRLVQPIPESPVVCQDQCGNGQCQEMVCMGGGCPCAETVESCPQDCNAAKP